MDNAICRLEDRFILLSVGTTTSYTRVTEGPARPPAGPCCRLFVFYRDQRVGGKVRLSHGRGRFPPSRRPS